MGSRATPVMDDMIRGLDDARAVRVVETFARARLRAGAWRRRSRRRNSIGPCARIFRQSPTRGGPSPSPGGPGPPGVAPPGRRPAKRRGARRPDRKALRRRCSSGSAKSPSSPPRWWCSRPTCSSSGTGAEKIHIKIEKKPTQDSLLRDLVQKLLSVSRGWWKPLAFRRREDPW